MIHVAYRLWGGDGFYAKMCGVSMLSMFENTEEKVTVHIMHNDRLTPDNREKFRYIANQYNQQIDFRNVEEIAGATLRKFEEVHPIKSGINAAWYPLIVHEVFPELDKLIFLGVDTIFNLDIAEMWAYDLKGTGYGIAAVPEIKSGVPKFHDLILDNVVKYEDYFNTDVMILKPSFFAENFELILDGCKFIHSNKKYTQNEQDVLSYLFSTRYLKLPGKFNIHVYFLRKPNVTPQLEKAIYHFAGGNNIAKPSLDTSDVFNKLYLEYFLKTPWATADIFGNIHKTLDRKFRKFNNNARDNLLHLTNLLSTRRRAFVIEDKYLERAKQIFEIKDDELVISFSSEIKGILEAMTKSKGEKIFYFFISNYVQYLKLRNFLATRDFVENTDFVDALMFLSERHGLNFNFDTKLLVREM